MPPLSLHLRQNARRPTVPGDLLALADAGQQAAVDAAILMLADFYLNGSQSRYARKLQNLPIWELKTQARGGAKGGTRVYFSCGPTAPPSSSAPRAKRATLPDQPSPKP